MQQNLNYLTNTRVDWILILWMCRWWHSWSSLLNNLLRLWGLSLCSCAIARKHKYIILKWYNILCKKILICELQKRSTYFNIGKDCWERFEYGGCRLEEGEIWDELLSNWLPEEAYIGLSWDCESGTLEER